MLSLLLGIWVQNNANVRWGEGGSLGNPESDYVIYGPSLKSADFVIKFQFCDLNFPQEVVQLSLAFTTVYHLGLDEVAHVLKIQTSTACFAFGLNYPYL